MGWAGGNGGGGNMPQVAAAQEVVLTIAGGLGDAETGGVVINVIPREGANTFSGQFNFSGSNDSLQGSNYTERLKDKGLRSPSELISVYDVNPMYGGRIVEDKLWFYGDVPPDRSEEHGPGHVLEQERRRLRRSGSVDFDRSKPAFTNTVERQATFRVTWQATPRNKINMHWAEQYPRLQLRPGRRRRDGRPADDAGSDAAVVLHPVRVNRMPRGPRRSRAGCWPRPAGACIRRDTASRRATTAPTCRG